MNYKIEITIDLPREEFLKKLDNPENMKHWQRGLTGYTLLSGNPGQEGAKMELRYTHGKRKMVLVETILKRNLPFEFHATYDAKGVHNIQKNYFSETDEGKTKWTSESHFKFSGLFMKLLALVMPGAFRKQSLLYAEDFKAFAENGVSVADK